MQNVAVNLSFSCFHGARDASFNPALKLWQMQGQKLLAVQDANLREQHSYQQKQAELEGNKEQVRTASLRILIRELSSHDLCSAASVMHLEACQAFRSICQGLTVSLQARQFIRCHL